MQTQRTTFDLSRETYETLKKLALEERVAMKDIVEKTVSEYEKRKKVKKRRSFEEVWADMTRLSKMGRRNFSLTKWVIADRDRRYREAKAGLG